MARIGIVAALDYEIRLFVERCGLHRLIEKPFEALYTGFFAGHSLTLVLCGVGKVNAAVCTQKLIDRFHPEYIIHTGFAGAVSKTLRPLDIAVADELTYHDFHPLSLLGKYAPFTERFTCDKDLKEAACRAAERLAREGGFRYETGTVVSGDMFVEDSAYKQSLRDRFDAVCTEMEGAAVAQTAYLSDVPFCVIRAISDSADEAADMTFDEMVPFAANRTAEIVTEMIRGLPV